MIIENKVKKYTVYTKCDSDFFISVFKDFLNFNLDIVRIFRSINDTKVMLINTSRGKYVFKVFAPKDKRFERFAKSFIKGDYYLNLFKQTDRVISEGLNFPNDFYLLAERKVFNYASIFIMIIEYVEGIELVDFDEVSKEIKEEISEKVQLLHQHNMVSGDPHKGNFIISPSGVRIIDLSGKKCNSQRKAKDRIDLERHFGIPNRIEDLGYYCLIYKKIIRLKVKNIKNKIREVFK
ncbi:LPS core heptose(II) kinase RfaY [Leminorella grimontii]|uniref:LPS core heptose(II) kinase RfaY n=1 Tax=Leminorella grimontii TaxID=82981 RepID=A0AAV5N8W5_9GAMM|nr:lipopolysaccharide core heptose(II) kinase RfaY [Leminorella grimontii]KFC98461.1 RfaY family lipopolysaccharide core biosynthesis protein [Leminorella grimontii ATCC 33999 = DSM 5078]GKX57192.1 LPS core heptose(II) kinase RfaY [Leminorella grimontii]VFS56026.1 Lipopolysaccharide core heptose(II) kinase rfaY [Leminorella grimontii]